MIAIQRYVLSQYKKCAAKRGYAFLLTDSQFLDLCSGSCVYCKKQNQNRAYRAQYAVKEWLYNGIDRVNSDLPYQVGNVVSCCGECNKAKSDRSVEAFVAWQKERNAK